MRKHTILFVNHVAYLGGAEVALVNLLTYLNRERYAPVVFAPAGELSDALSPLNVPCVHIPVLPGLNRYTLAHFFSLLPRLIWRIKREHPDLLYANTNFTSLYTGLLTKLLNIPAIGHIRDIEPLGRLGRRLVRQNTKILAISQAVQNYLIQEQVPEQKIALVYDGVDLQQFRPQPITKGKERTSPLIIGVVGQIGARKGQLYLLEAARIILQTHSQVMFWIVGKEPTHSRERYTEQLQQYIKQMSLEQHVKLWGFRADIPDILAQLDILVLPSLQEPFGKIVIEAMAMSKPVVASRVGGVPEIVVDGKTGILVPPKDPIAIQRALAQLVNDREKREQMGIEGRKRVEQYFSLQGTVKQTEQIYEQIFTTVGKIKQTEENPP